MKIKVCGMKFPSSIKEVAGLDLNYMGFIFYPRSPRYAEPLDQNALNEIPKSIKKIGVFVNEDIEKILTFVFKYKLDGVQLHGTENGEICEKLKDAGLIVLKAFSISEASNFQMTKRYEGKCDYFLFDTKTELYGGSGMKFNWTLLEEYNGNTPFLLSGGISVDDALDISRIKHPMLAGVDLNSKFEIQPGEKDLASLKTFIRKLKENI